MAVTEDRRYTKAFVYNLLEGVKGKTLGEVIRLINLNEQKLVKKLPELLVM